MGGTALGFQAKRMNKEQFITISADVVEKIRSLGYTADVIPAYRDKDDFGDIDIVVMLDETVDSTTQIDRELGAIEHSQFAWADKKSKIISLGIPLDDGVVQVDLIHIARQSYDFALRYFSYNDCGNLLGRFFHKLGLKFGHDGLWMPVNAGTDRIGNIVVTRDFSAALRLIGYDPEVHLEGFQTLEEMFKYVADNDLFNPSIYLLENRNSIARVRDKKRKTYTAFLKWCESLGEKDWYVFPEDKRIWNGLIFTEFPHAAQDHFEIHRRHSLQLMAREKFNGDIVGRLTGLSGKQLGEFIRYLTNGTKYHQSAIIARTAEVTEQLIKDDFEHWQKHRHELFVDHVYKHL